jgi:hypothetical protein
MRARIVAPGPAKPRVIHDARAPASADGHETMEPPPSARSRPRASPRACKRSDLCLDEPGHPRTRPAVREAPLPRAMLLVRGPATSLAARRARPRANELQAPVRAASPAGEPAHHRASSLGRGRARIPSGKLAFHRASPFPRRSSRFPSCEPARPRSSPLGHGQACSPAGRASSQSREPARPRATPARSRASPLARGPRPLSIARARSQSGELARNRANLLANEALPPRHRAGSFAIAQARSPVAKLARPTGSGLGSAKRGILAAEQARPRASSLGGGADELRRGQVARHRASSLGRGRARSSSAAMPAESPAAIDGLSVR